MPGAGPKTTPRRPGPVRRAIRQALTDRPASFYLLFAIPVVMLLALPLFAYRDDPMRFTFLLALQFIFLGIVLIRAVMDLFEIGFKHYREDRENFKNTLGDEDFVSELGRRVKGEDEE